MEYVIFLKAEDRFGDKFGISDSGSKYQSTPVERLSVVRILNDINVDQ